MSDGGRMGEKERKRERERGVRIRGNRVAWNILIILEALISDTFLPKKINSIHGNSNIM